MVHPALGSPAQERRGFFWMDTEEATQIIRGMDHLFQEQMRTELELFSLENRRLKAGLIVAFQYLKAAYKKDGEEPYTRACRDRQEGMASYWKGITLHRLRRKFLLQGQLAQVAQESWGCPIFEVFKTGWMELWATWSSGRCPCPWQWTRNFQVCSQHKPVYDSIKSSNTIKCNEHQCINTTCSSTMSLVSLSKHKLLFHINTNNLTLDRKHKKSTSNENVKWIEEC